jgi:AAA family ATP:ADP antiporter
MTAATANPGQPIIGAKRVRRLELLAALRPGEGPCVALCFMYAFLLLVCLYILKTLREALLLAEGSAEIKSYAYATVAAVLLVLVPLYGVAFRRVEKAWLIRGVTLFFVVNLAGFYFAGRAGLDIGFVYYVWVGVFGVTIVAQFWAHAADLFDVSSGQRLFPAIMLGATLGGLVAPAFVPALFAKLGPWPLLLIATGLLIATLPLVCLTQRSVPEGSRNAACHAVARGAGPLGGLALVLRDRYLLLLATLAVLLNCVSTTGEYVLTELVLHSAEKQLAVDPELDRATIIAAFYARFYLAVNGLAVVTQLLLAARLFKAIGVQGVVLVLPVIALIGYGLIAFLPIVAILQLLKVVENAVDYSVMNTARQALFLPLPASVKYEAKVAIDAFCWRFGDLLQAAIVFVGLNWLGLEYGQFALVNVALASGWLVAAAVLAHHYCERASVTRRPSPAHLAVLQRHRRGKSRTALASSTVS